MKLRKKSKANNIKLSKYSAAGNIIIVTSYVPMNKKKFTREVFNKSMGQAGDGIVFLNIKSKSWCYFNKDGSRAGMCGNAIRASMHYVFEETGLSKINFKTDKGLVGAEVVKSPRHKEWIIKCRFTAPKKMKNIEGQFPLWDSGVPHVLVQVNKKINNQEITSRAALIKKLRFHSDAGRAGANVTLYHHMRENLYEAVTFERGVEDFTLACGTGALAVAAENFSLQDTVNVHMPGGVLQIKKTEEETYLLGPSVKLMEICLSADPTRAKVTRS